MKFVPYRPSARVNPPRHHISERGVALIIVLSVIVLISALVVGFLLRAGSDRTATSSYSAKVTTRQLADMAINLVQGQINDATTGTNTAWASQPGALRVFDNSGTLLNIYRLYSSGSGLTTTNTADLANDLPSVDWSSSPAAWVDLNAPIIVQGVFTGSSGVSGTTPIMSYPILDPRNPLDPGTNSTPNVLTAAQMPGFFLGTSNGTGVVPGTTAVPVATGSSANPAPMPVMWMYVLKDGSIVSPVTGGNGSVVTIAAASGTNPIVGRIAFWTDDETCKVNINTAAGSLSYRPDPTTNYQQSSYLPAPWETPRFKIWDDLRLFAENQPVHMEYQRYPGHPATTNLYSILSGPTTDGTLGGLGLGFLNANPQYPPDANVPSPNYLASGTMPPPTSAGASSFYTITPRYGDSMSSYGGTAATIYSGSAVTVSGTAPNRLYSSVGELIYSTGTAGAERAKNGIAGATDNLTRQQVETGKFFLTAQSRAPEVNLFGTPRISVWPIDSAYGSNPVPSNTTPYASAYDKLIAFCTTTGVGNGIHRYYFQRHDSTSPTNDYDGRSSDYGGVVYNGNGVGIPRNTQLYSYLQYLTDKQIPGFGGSFSSKYGVAGERDQILTEMVDYVRSTNMIDHSGTASSFTPGRQALGGGQVVPLQIGVNSASIHGVAANTQGLGRMFTISEVGLLVICTADGNSTISPTGYVAPASVSGTLTSTVKGSANDYRYVSNLPVAQFLRDANTSSDPLGMPTGLNPAATGSSTYVSYFPVHSFLTGGTSSFPRDNTYSLSAANYFPANPTLADTYGGPLNPLTQGHKRLQAMLVIEVQCPMQGYDDIWWPDFNIKFSGLENISIAGTNPFPASEDGVMVTWGPSRHNSNTNTGGYQLFQTVLTKFDWASDLWNKRTSGWSGMGGYVAPNSAPGAPGFSYSPPWSTPSAHTSGTTDYRAISNPFTIADTGTNGQMTISSGAVGLEIQVNPKTGTGPVTVQKFNVTFPSTTTPTPDLLRYGLASVSSGTNYYLTSAADWWGFDNRLAWACGGPAFTSGTSTMQGIGCVIRSDPNTTPGVWTYMTSSGSIPVTLYKDNKGNPPATLPPSDVIRTLIAKDGDVRLVMAKSVVKADGQTDMTKTAGYTSNSVKLADNLTCDRASDVMDGSDQAGSLIPGIGGTSGTSYITGFSPKVPSNVAPQSNWDWDTGLPTVFDGAYGNKPDEGNVYINGAGVPYYQGGNLSPLNASWFTANRIIPSPVMFGSLPTGVMENIPWRTLQFRPIKTITDGGTLYNHDVRSSGNTMYTLTGPQDHLLLDLFTMPVVEPYAISEPFSTAGKINMNYQILPFTYITRSTGIRAVLGSELVARVPAAAAGKNSSGNSYYKGQPGAGISTPPGSVSIARLPLNLDEFNGTLRQFSDKFANKDVFKSPSEICDSYLVPKGYTWDGASSPDFDLKWYGDDFALVGDNVREHPYGDIYPRLTTKSNTFTVYFKVQAIQNSAANPTQWNEKTGAIKAEYRGSATLERYLDPADSTIPDYGDGTDPKAPGKASLESFYKWRVIANSAFPP